MEGPKTPPKPSNCVSRKLMEHLTSAHKFKENMIEKTFDNKVYQAYFTEEVVGMDVDVAVLIYLDPSMLILGPMMDFGSPHPNDKRDEETRKMERQISRIKAMERFLMIASGVEVECILAMTNPNLFVKWTLFNVENGRKIPSMIPSRTMMQKAATLAKMMVEREAWKQQLIILENLNKGTDMDQASEFSDENFNITTGPKNPLNNPSYIETMDQCSEDCNNISKNFYLEIGNKIISIFHKISTPVLKKEKNDKPISYGREFLLKCAQSPLCSKAPPNWDHFVMKYPGLAKARMRKSKLEKILPKISYDREFLLKCAQSDLCNEIPSNWAEVVLKYPGMIKGKSDFNLKVKSKKLDVPIKKEDEDSTQILAKSPPKKLDVFIKKEDKDSTQISVKSQPKKLDVFIRDDITYISGLQRLIGLCEGCQTDPPCYVIEKRVIGFFKWFDFKNNVGFVTTEKDKTDIFLPESGIKPPKSYWPYLIFPNQKCLFDIGNCKSGRIAYNLTAIFS